MAGVDYQPLKVCVIHQGFQNLFPDSLVTPPAESAMYVLPVSIRPGKSRQGAPVRKIQNTPLISCWLSRALPPSVLFSPMVYGLIFSHALLLISCRCCSVFVKEKGEQKVPQKVSGSQQRAESKREGNREAFCSHFEGPKREGPFGKTSHKGNKIGNPEVYILEVRFQHR